MSDSTKPTTALMTHEEQKAVYEAQDVLARKSNILMRIGQIQGFNIVAKHATVSEILIFREIRNSKEYKGLAYTKNGETLTVGTLEEFCPVFLNRSYKTMDELDKNLEKFGQEFFEQAQHLGLGYRELRKLRSLPDDELLQFKEHEALESGDKDVIREVIDDLHAKHKKEKADLNTSLDDVKADLAATREINAEKSRIEEDLRIKLEKAKYTPENWQQKVIDTIETMVLSANGAFVAEDKFRQILTLIDTESTNGENSQEAMEHATSVYMDLVERLAQRFALLLEDAVQLLPFQHMRKPAEEVLHELANQGADKFFNGTL